MNYPNIQLKTYQNQKNDDKDITFQLLEKTQELTINSPPLNSASTQQNPSSLLSNTKQFFDKTLTQEEIKQLQLLKIGAPSNPLSHEISPIQQALTSQGYQMDDFVLDKNVFKNKQTTQKPTWNTDKCQTQEDEVCEMSDSSDEQEDKKTKKSSKKDISKSENLRPQKSPKDDIKFEPLEPVKNVTELKFLEQISKNAKGNKNEQKTILFQQIESATPNIVPSEDPATFFGTTGNNSNSIKLANIILDFPIICQQQNCDFQTNEFNSFRIHQKSHKHLPNQSFKCEKCGFTCKKISYLDQHIKINHTEKTYSCDICQKGNLSQLGLYQHKREVHSTQAFKCNLCQGKVFKTKGSYNWHMRYVHSQGYYKCSKCKYSTVSKVQMSNHNMNHHQHFTCKFCDFTTNIRKKLREHCFSHHKQEIDGIKDIDTYLFKDLELNKSQNLDYQREESDSTSLNVKKQNKIQDKLVIKQQIEPIVQQPLVQNPISPLSMNLNFGLPIQMQPEIKSFKPINFLAQNQIVPSQNVNSLQCQQKIQILQKKLQESQQKQQLIQQQNQQLLNQFQNQQNVVIQQSQNSFQQYLDFYKHDLEIKKRTKLEHPNNN